mmetsp:Transcript_65260/g.199645  ORF Transcript_65260/g.199645 Transcript_65260/m.199645 type:complete len:282 (-) Transcript_65260:1664-2509(-)
MWVSVWVAAFCSAASFARNAVCALLADASSAASRCLSLASASNAERVFADSVAFKCCSKRVAARSSDSMRALSSFSVLTAPASSLLKRSLSELDASLDDRSSEAIRACRVASERFRADSAASNRWRAARAARRWSASCLRRLASSVEAACKRCASPVAVSLMCSISPRIVDFSANARRAAAAAPSRRLCSSLAATRSSWAMRPSNEARSLDVAFSSRANRPFNEATSTPAAFSSWANSLFNEASLPLATFSSCANWLRIKASSSLAAFSAWAKRSRNDASV